MGELNDRKRRFDETFRTLLVIVTITTTFSFNLYRDALGTAFFLDIFLFFIASIIIWGFSNLAGGKYEYAWKLLAWHFLIFDIVVSFTRITLGQLLTSPVLGVVVLLVILVPTSWIKGRLEEAQAIPAGTISRIIFLALGIFTLLQIYWITVI